MSREPCRLFRFDARRVHWRPGLLSGYGDAFVARLALSYPQLPQLMDRVRLYQGTFALMEALFGIENGDDEAFESSIAEYC